MSEYDRRIDRNRWVPAEKAIQDAVDAIEILGADTRLTSAVVLLVEARGLVADFVDCFQSQEET